MEAPPVDRIRHQLGLEPTSAAELAKALRVHQSTISRAIASLQANGEVVRLLGPTRGARYGLTRRMGSVGSSWPLYRIDGTGTPMPLGVLHALARDQYYIANTDRHFGNVTLFDQYQGSFELAPVYDMLPMLFAPQQDFLIERTFIPPRPRAASLGAWRSARAMALNFWDRLTHEMRLSPQFRQIATACRQAVHDSPAL